MAAKPAGDIYTEIVRLGHSKLLQSQTPTGVDPATIEFVTGFSSEYDVYLFDIKNLVMVTVDTNLIMQFLVSAGWVGGNGSYAWTQYYTWTNPVGFGVGGQAAGGGAESYYIRIGSAQAFSYPLYGYVEVSANPGLLFQGAIWHTTHLQASIFQISCTGGGQLCDPTYAGYQIMGVRFLSTSGLISRNTTIRCYGMKRGL